MLRPLHLIGMDIRDDEETNIVTVPYHENPELQEAYAERLVACYNSCVGINPEAVPALLAVAKAVIGRVVDLDDVEAMALAAIARAEKG